MNLGDDDDDDDAHEMKMQLISTFNCSVSPRNQSFCRYFNSKSVLLFVHDIAKFLLNILIMKKHNDSRTAEEPDLWLNKDEGLFLKRTFSKN